jgi:hypothetical protein
VLQKWTLTASVTIMVVFGALLALENPERKRMMIAFVFLCQVRTQVSARPFGVRLLSFPKVGFGWAQYISMAFIQFGVPQVGKSLVSEMYV